MIEIRIQNLTDVVRRVWEEQRKQNPAPKHHPGYVRLCQDSPVRLGAGLHYIYRRETKPATRRTSSN
jgi:hypothetical protein